MLPIEERTTTRVQLFHFNLSVLNDELRKHKDLFVNAWMSQRMNKLKRGEGAVIISNTAVTDKGGNTLEEAGNLHIN